MGKDILSQNEIDSLITALSSGKLEEEEEKGDEEVEQYRTYDFRRPSKFSKEQLRTLQIIHENYARILGNFLSAYLRVPVQVQLASISQVTYEEFTFSLPVPTLMTIFDMSPEMGTAMLETNPSFVFPLIDLVFGGEGEGAKQTRELTDIEITVMRQLNSKLLENLKYVWEDITELDPKIEGMDTNPQFNQMFASTETAALLTFTTQIKESEGLINLCFPFISLEQVMPKLTAQYWFKQAPQESTPFQESVILKQIETVDVELSAVMGQTVVTLEEFLQFREGDILQLSLLEGDDLDVFVEDQRLFKGQPGTVGQNLGVKITRCLDEDEYEEEEEAEEGIEEDA